MVKRNEDFDEYGNYIGKSTGKNFSSDGLIFNSQFIDDIEKGNCSDETKKFIKDIEGDYYDVLNGNSMDYSKGIKNLKSDISKKIDATPLHWYENSDLKDEMVDDILNKTILYDLKKRVRRRTVDRKFVNNLVDKLKSHRDTLYGFADGVLNGKDVSVKGKSKEYGRGVSLYTQVWKELC